jgi:hypothetical protein
VVAAAAVMVMAVTATWAAMAVTAMQGMDMEGMDTLGTDTRATVMAILAIGMGTVAVGTTVIGTPAVAAIGTVGGGPMALAHAGVSRPAAGSGSAIETRILRLWGSRPGVPGRLLFAWSLAMTGAGLTLRSAGEIWSRYRANGCAAAHRKPSGRP